MRVIALTGGIATGKSTVSSRWASQIPVIDADVVAHRVLDRQSVKDKLVKLFGAQVIVEDKVDRKVLGRIVFSDPKAKVELEELTHPLVRQSALGVIDMLQAMGHKLICYDVPLLFETNTENDYDAVVVVTAHPAIQLTRLMQRNSLSEVDAQARIDAQMSLKMKVSRADYVIDNSSSVENLNKQADLLLQGLQR